MSRQSIQQFVFYPAYVLVYARNIRGLFKR